MIGPPAGTRRRAVVILPNGFTLANLFFGVFAIVSASRGQFAQAVLWIVVGGICDALDGRVARATNTGSRFGSELDSLVDGISFGLAPAMIMYFAVLNREGWDWIFVFLFVACAVIRLARFNIEQAGRAKTHFHGLPSPAAGITLATYYWFSQTPLYTQTVLVDLPWHQMLRWIMLGLSFLMISNVSYPAVPTVGLRTWQGLVGLAMVLGTIVGVIFLPREFFFPALMAYVVYGVVKSAILGMIDRMPDEDPWSVEPSAPLDHRAPEEVHPVRRRRRRRRGGRGDSPERPSP